MLGNPLVGDNQHIVVVDMVAEDNILEVERLPHEVGPSEVLVLCKVVVVVLGKDHDH